MTMDGESLARVELSLKQADYNSKQVDKGSAQSLPTPSDALPVLSSFIVQATYHHIDLTNPEPSGASKIESIVIDLLNQDQVSDR